MMKARTMVMMGAVAICAATLASEARAGAVGGGLPPLVGDGVADDSAAI